MHGLINIFIKLICKNYFATGRPALVTVYKLSNWNKLIFYGEYMGKLIHYIFMIQITKLKNIGRGLIY